MSEPTSKLPGVLAAEGPKLLACIHCGLCLEACPTYVHTADENDSPRGRIYLMRAVGEGRLGAASPGFERHVNRCLGCRACESACPAGVEYGQLLEAARADIREGGRRRGHTDRLLDFTLRHVWSRPRRLRLAFAAARLLRDTGFAGLLLKSRLPRLVSPRAEFALALLVSSAPSIKGGGSDAGAEVVPAHAGGRGDATAAAPEDGAGRVQMFEGCVGAGLFARVNRAAERVLAANGCAVETTPAQVCCGALHAHAGDLEGARRLARRNIEAFAGGGAARVVTTAGGCGAMLASYAQMLEHDADYAARARAFSARVRDVSQQLAATGLREGAPLDAREAATYDASCHLIHGQRAFAEPPALLAAVPGLAFAPLEGSEVCCGGAGVYNLLEPDLSARVLAEKLARIGETGARLVATGNPGCHMQLGAGARLAGLAVRVCHPVELLDESYRRAGIYADAGRVD
ncbi:MAG: 4Fe-4S dicluster domain-containing protein [Acidobacteria bacterium]|nr:4Fe-4S dicluster domain-containing protein [Acidobacteriota bacterium]